jgi:hypothetical protein
MKRLAYVLVLVVLLAVAAAPAYAQGNGRPGLVSFGRDVVVQAGEMVNGDVVAFGGNVTVESRARIIGDVVAFGGNVRSAGEVDQSVVALGGDIDLLAGSLVRKDAVTIGGAVSQADGARVMGSISRGFTFDLGEGAPSSPWMPPQPIAPAYGRPWAGDLALSIVMGFVLGVLKILVLAALAVVMVAIFPRQIAGVRATLLSQPGPSAGVGCLTYLAAIGLTLPLLLTCIGNFLMWPVLIIATTFGVGALGLIVGERLTGAQGAQPKPAAFNAALGTGLTCLVLLVLDAVPFVACFSWVFWLLVASLATGAVVLSKFGTQVPASGPALMFPQPSGAAVNTSIPEASVPIVQAATSSAPVPAANEAPPVPPSDAPAAAGQ